MTTVIDSLIVSLGLDAKSFKKGEKDATNTLASFGKTSTATNKKIQSDLSGSAKSFKSLKVEIAAVAAAFISVHALKSFAENITTGDAALGRLAANLNTNVETLSVWTKMADKAGGTADGMQSSIAGLVDQIQTFAQTGQGGDAFKYFTSQNISLVDSATGKMRDFQDILLDSADVLSKINKTKGQAAAQAWGKGMGFDPGTVNVLLRGSDAVKSLADEQRKNAIVTGDNALKAQQMQIAWNKMSDTMENVGRDVLTSLSPMIIKLTEEFGTWIKTLDLNAINAELHNFIKYIIAIDFKSMRDGAKDVVDVLKPLVDGLGRIVTGWKLIGDEVKVTAPLFSKVVDDVKTGIGAAATAFGKLVSRGEGNYSSVNVQAHGGGSSQRDLSSMSINEVLAKQNKGEFGAAGRYQMIRGTLDEASRKMGLTGEEKFTPEMQDKIFNEHLLKKRKALYAYLHGMSSDISAAAEDASKEWASFTDPTTGKGHYAGQKASISLEDSYKALQSARTQIAAGGTGNPVSNTTSHDVKVGAVNVYTQATDATGMAKSVDKALQTQLFAAQANHQ
jgi:muramidase (phage lysozyme)